MSGRPGKAVFVSYSSSDADRAGNILDFLEGRGVSCWMAPRDIPAGADWAAAIVDAIENASRLLLVLSESSNRSPQVRRELEQAVSCGIPIVPIRIGEVELSKWMRYCISTHQWHDALEEDLESCMEGVLEVLGSPVSNVTADLSNLSVMMEEDIRRLESTIDAVAARTSRLQPGERRRVAVLSLRLAGLTEQGGTLLPRAMVSVRDTVEAMVRRVIEAYGGYLTKPGPLHFRSIFGVKRAKEDDSYRAVSSAVKLAQGLRELRRVLSTRGIALDFGMGASAGPIEVVTDGTGDPITRGEILGEARDLADPTGEGALLVTESVYRGCGGGFSFEPCDAAPTNGLYRLTGDSPGPGPIVLGDAGSGPFVGREEELEELRNALQRQESGVGNNRRGGARHIVLGISGEAGVGKSRLVAELMEEIGFTSGDVQVLWGRACSSAQPPYFLWRTVIENLLYKGDVPSMDYDELRRRVSALTDGEGLVQSAPFLARILSIHSEDPRVEELDDRALALETTTAVRDLVESVASSRRTILVLDDLQWMGETCRKVLEFVVANCDTRPAILFVLLYRPERDSGEPVRIEIHPGYAELAEIRLGRLERRACADLLVEVLRYLDPDAEVVEDGLLDLVLRKSGGNPYFLREMVMDLVESRAVETVDGEWVPTGSLDEVLVPDSLAGLLQSRLDRLPTTWRNVLQRASVLGVEFPLPLLDALSERVVGRKAERETLAGLESKDLLARKTSAFESRCRFTQLLLRDTAYGSLTDRNRAILHHAAAECIEDIHGGEEEKAAEALAYHWERAGRADRALGWGMSSLRLHARSSQADGALDMAGKLEEWLQELPQEGSNGELLVEVLLLKADALDLKGRRTEQESELRKALRLADTSGAEETRAHVRERLGWFLMNTGRSREAMQAYEEALELARSAGARRLEGRIVGGMVTVHRQKGRPDDAERCVNRSLRVAREVGDEWSERRNLGNLGILHRDRGRFEDAIGCFEASLRLARKTGSRRDEATILGNLGNLYRERGSPETALERLGQALRIALEIGSRGAEGIILGNMGILHDQMGRIAKAEECHLKSLDIRREVGNRKGEGIALGNLGTLCMKQNRFSEADDYYRKSLGIAREIGARNSEGITCANLGILSRKQGRLDDAESYCKRALEIARQSGARRSEALTMGSMGYLHLLRGRHSRALECYRRVCDMVSELQLGASEFEELVLLREGLLNSGVDRDEVPWPDHWPAANDA